MNVKMPHKRDRGQVGIGTLIVFIAMVLVAAIAAGVLINTAGFLQSQSEQTGQQSSSQVSDRVQVVNTVGDNIGNQKVWTINMTVKKAPGANDIDLNTTTIQFISDDQIVDLIHAERDSAGTAFNTTTIQDDDDSITDSKVLNDQEDRARIMLDLGSASDNITTVDTGDIDAIEEGDEATIEVTTQAGGTTTATLTVPDSLSGKDAVNL
ncbi:MAG: archaellin/type IV pilin N-terminal domain-containing protein [Haloarculaceae archaeon]